MTKTAWRYEIKYGPEGEANYAWVYDADGDMVCTAKTHHAEAIVARMNSTASLQGEDAVERVALPPIPDDDTDFTPDLARKIIAKYQAILATGLVPDEAAVRADASYLDFFEKHTDMELSCSWEDDDGPWEVHSVTGGRNDREWTKVGQGATPREAIAAAIRSGGGE